MVSKLTSESINIAGVPYPKIAEITSFNGLALIVEVVLYLVVYCRPVVHHHWEEVIGKVFTSAET